MIINMALCETSKLKNRSFPYDKTHLLQHRFQLANISVFLSLLHHLSEMVIECGEFQKEHLHHLEVSAVQGVTIFGLVHHLFIV